MQQRFDGDDGKRRLADALLNQRLVSGSSDIASAIANTGVVRHVAVGERLIEEGSYDNSLFLIVSGSFSVVVRGHEVAKRGQGDTVGEIAAVDPSQPRSADVFAESAAVVVELTEPQLARLAEQHPVIWKRIAVDMARRLVQRNTLVNPVNTQIRVFIMSSVEGLPVAREIQSGLAHDEFLVVVWTNGVFMASHYPLESLEAQLEAADFAIAIAHPDDRTESRGQSQQTPRDNVIFELGFFMGKLGRRRTILVEPREDRPKLPSDLMGLTAIGYRSGPPEQLAANLGPVCTALSKAIQAGGPK